MRGFARSLGQGAVVGLVIGAVLIVVAGGYLLVTSSQTVSDPTKIVGVFAMAREDGAPVAHTVAISSSPLEDETHDSVCLRVYKSVEFSTGGTDDQGHADIGVHL